MRLLVCLLILAPFFGSAQNELLLIGPEYNFYPAGHLIGLQAEYSPNKNHHSFNARLAANITRRKNFSGLNDNEWGNGYGGSLGYRYYFQPDCHGLYLGTRADLWFININWSDSSAVIKEGTTEIIVLQPTFELGYLFKLGKGWEIGTAFVNGAEINVKMKGDPVGQGWVSLWQLRITKEISLNK